MTTRTFKDATKALQACFSAAKVPASLPNESRRTLQNFVEERETITEEESARANEELRHFWERFVGENPAKTGAFVGVLRELQPAIFRESDIIEWWHLVVKPVITGTGYRKAVLDDAQEFLIASMMHTDNDEATQQHSKTATRLTTDLLSIYIARTRGITEEDPFVAPENAQVAQQVENVLVAFGRKQPKDLFHSLDDLVTSSNTRLQALTLLSSFLRHQTPHLYLVINTPLVEHLLKCLTNDTSTTILSVALTSLIMLLPHIPGSLGPHLPRLFLVYSRLLCWEKFSPLSTEAQKNLVTDDRIIPDTDHGDVGIDQSWEKARPIDGVIEVATPELMTYFTYLYGLYPLNFTSYIRKPRRYLKNLEFPGADDFDLDQAVIRSRTEQYRQVHLLHPNFYNMTVEEELIDPKWPRTDPADVVADCHGLCVNNKPTLLAPGPPPTSKLPEVPAFPPLAGMKGSAQVSPSTSHASFRSGNSWRDTQSTAVTVQGAEGDSPVLRPKGSSEDDVGPRLKSGASVAKRASPNIDDFPQPGGLRTPKEKEEAPQTNLAYLQRETTLLRNELNFERWHKAQYSQHISQLMRKNIKDATAEAETLNLINANRTLQMKLDQVRSAREATMKDSALTRKQANSLEANMTERFNAMRKEQEQWHADADELKRLRKETGQFRQLLVATEARELNKSHHLEIIKRELEEMQKVKSQLHDAQRKLREYEFREFEMDQAKRENGILLAEKETLQMRLKRSQHDHERAHRAYADKLAELEGQLEGTAPPARRPPMQPSQDSQSLVQQAIADSQAKLVQLKRKHTQLMEKYTDLEMEYESVRAQLDALQGNRNGDTFYRESGGDSYTTQSYDRGADTMSGGLGHPDSAYDTASDIQPFSENAYMTSASEPTSRRYQTPVGNLPVFPPGSEATFHHGAGLTWKPAVSRQESMASRSSGAPATFNQTAPISAEEASKSDRSEDGTRKKEKITPDSQVRVYGRGGAQNIKMKSKEKEKQEKAEKSRGGLRGLKGII